MISIIIYKNKRNHKEYVGFSCKGHAGSADYGKDLVCCAVSTLVINTINSIEELTDTHFDLESDESTGYIKMIFNKSDDNEDYGISKDTSLLMDSLIIGIKGLMQDNKKYLRLEIREV